MYGYMHRDLGKYLYRQGDTKYDHERVYIKGDRIRSWWDKVCAKSEVDGCKDIDKIEKERYYREIDDYYKENKKK